MAEEVTVLDSILLSVKQNIGIVPENTDFDPDIIMAINSVFGILKQIGVKSEDYLITGDTETWSDYLSDITNLEIIKNYMCLRVGLIFDPPQNSSIIDIKKQLISELEWRISVTVDPGEEE